MHGKAAKIACRNSGVNVSKGWQFPIHGALLVSSTGHAEDQPRDGGGVLPGWTKHGVVAGECVEKYHSHNLVTAFACESCDDLETGFDVSR